MEYKLKKIDNPTFVGEVSFKNGTLFIRNNIIVEICQFGTINQEEALIIAKRMDELIKKQVILVNKNDLKPTITMNNGKMEIIEP
ncbi:MAG: hypothetical protein HC905_24845 [Bacteroidales bacterium]|nr:hypothetical protein [Bacteroidales bacterium]